MDREQARLEKAQAAAERAQTRLKQAKQALRHKETKRETRRKILIGAIAREHANRNPDSTFAKELASLLDRTITKPAERELLGLDPRPETGEDQAASPPPGEQPNPRRPSNDQGGDTGGFWSLRSRFE